MSSNVVRIGLDLAKSVFQVHGVNAAGKAVLVKTLRRAEMLTFFSNLPACLVGMEACAGSHYWGRELIKLGHDARLIAAQFVAPYRLWQECQERCQRRGGHLRSRWPTQHALRTLEV